MGELGSSVVSKVHTVSNVHIASYPGLSICGDGKKRLGIDCIVHVHNLNISSNELVHNFTFYEVCAR